MCIWKYLYYNVPVRINRVGRESYGKKSRNCIERYPPVSYTHLDVYKRQVLYGTEQVGSTAVFGLKQVKPCFIPNISNPPSLGRPFFVYHKFKEELTWTK